MIFSFIFSSVIILTYILHPLVKVHVIFHIFKKAYCQVDYCNDCAEIDTTIIIDIELIRVNKDRGITIYYPCRFLF